MKTKLLKAVVSVLFILVALVGLWASYSLGRATVASKIRGTVEVNGSLDKHSKVFRTNTNSALVQIGKDYYLLNPFHLILDQDLWRLGDHLISYKELYSRNVDIFVGTYKWDPPYAPRLETHSDGSITFFTYKGDRVRVVPEPSLSLSMN